MNRLALVLLAALMSAAAGAGDAKYENIVLSDVKGGAPARVFKPSTPAIVLTAGVSGVSEGTQLKAQWIAEKTDAAPPDYLIDAKEVAAKATSRAISFSLSRPGPGWPLGSYRVELLVDGKVVARVPFTVAR